LRLPTRELRRPHPRQPGEVEALQPLHGDRPRRAERHVLEHREVRKKQVVLKDEADATLLDGQLA
jgi:hypothetical protein